MLFGHTLAVYLNWWRKNIEQIQDPINPQSSPSSPEQGYQGDGPTHFIIKLMIELRVWDEFVVDVYKDSGYRLNMGTESP